MMTKIIGLCGGAILGWFASKFPQDAEASKSNSSFRIEVTISAPNCEQLSDSIPALLDQYGCNSCHHLTTRLVGPPFEKIAAKEYTNQQIVVLLYDPQPEHWPGYPAMPAQRHLPEKHAEKIAAWINSL